MKYLTVDRLDRASRFLWALTLVAIPMTSFQYVPFIGANSQVKPLSFIPGTLLLLLLLVKSIIRRKLILWNNSLVPLLAFILAALVFTVAGFLRAPVELYQYTFASRALRAWVTFGVGLIFYLTAASMVKGETDLKFTMKWLYIGLAAQVVWSLFQLGYIYLIYPRSFDGGGMARLQHAIWSLQIVLSSAPIAYNQRVSGLTLEPSWLAAQVLTIYLPWAFAGALKSYRWTHSRWLLPAILAACAFLLVFTFSRSGLVTALGIIVVALAILGWDKIRQVFLWFFAPGRLASGRRRPRSVETGMRLLIAVVILAVLFAGGYVLSQNEYLARMWQSDEKSLVGYMIDIYAGPRFAYAWTGWQIFDHYPWTGVGLGGAGLYLHRFMPDWSRFNMPEIAQLLSSANTAYPNIKNLYLRLLAETGILGFWLFISFYLLVFGKVLKLLRSPRKFSVFMGAAGLLAWLAIVAIGLSQDSLAMLNIWLPLGIVAGFADHEEAGGLPDTPAGA